MEAQHVLDISLGVIGVLGLFILRAIWGKLDEMVESLQQLIAAQAAFSEWKISQTARTDNHERRIERLELKGT